jgi:hypothetical protein
MGVVLGAPLTSLFFYIYFLCMWNLRGFIDFVAGNSPVQPLTKVLAEMNKVKSWMRSGPGKMK